jgi:hypothetical protein
MSGCTSDAECQGKPCAYLVSSNSCINVPSLRCGVECEGPADCESWEKCVNGGCQIVSSTCGRPFLVEGTARVAPPAIRRDWIQGAAPLLEGIDEDVRAALGAHWTELGLMEHASVAAFARFVLQLLSIGAPASLVASATAALGDETEHARLCFGIASAYAGRSIGPGALGWRFVTWALETANASARRGLLRDFDALVAASDAAPPRAMGDGAALLAHGVPSPALRSAIRCGAAGDVVRPCLAALAARFGESAAAPIAAAA